ncbi:MAG: type IX secretion system membrane protein PorP/SprF [Flavobacteriales bacterium]|nr:type IX secretion system membrane protein PorP/SprF [Flavobacteriales bacterium]
MTKPTSIFHLSSERQFAVLFLVALFILLAVLTSRGQQQPGYSQFMWDQLVINPGYAGTTESWSARLFYRNQWSGFEGAPQTQHISIQTPLSNRQFGAGLHMTHDQLGISEQFSATASAAYHLKMRFARLSFGLNGEYAVQRMNWSTLHPTDEGDAELPFADASVSSPNFGFGLYLHSPKYYVGLAIPKLLESDLDYSGSESLGTADYSLRRHYFLTAGYAYTINPNLILKPGLMTRYVHGAPVQVDVNVSALINKKIWIGGGYRFGDSAQLMVQYHLTPYLAVGYAYDFTLTRIQNHFGSHEVFVGWDMQRKRDGYDHPRYF